MKYIGIGNCTKYYINLLIAFICEFLICSIPGLNSPNSKNPARIIYFKPKINEHKLLFTFIRIASIFFGGLFLYIVERANKLKRRNEITIGEIEKMKESLIDNKGGSIRYNLLLIGIFFSLILIVQGFLDLTKMDLSLWSLEMVYIAIISFFIFKLLN